MTAHQCTAVPAVQGFPYKLRTSYRTIAVAAGAASQRYVSVVVQPRQRCFTLAPAYRTVPQPVVIVVEHCLFAAPIRTPRQ